MPRVGMSCSFSGGVGYALVIVGDRKKGCPFLAVGRDISRTGSRSYDTVATRCAVYGNEENPGGRHCAYRLSRHRCVACNSREYAWMPWG
jgi:hypothetical protein